MSGSDILNIILAIASGVCTLIGAVCTYYSIKAARKSNEYYNKSKQLTIYANTNIAYIESKKIIETLLEITKLGKVTRGNSYINNKVSLYGENIRKSIDKIRESLEVEDFKEINKILNSPQLKIDTYIDSFISGSVIVGERFVVDDKFNKCQQAFYDMQLLIKVKIENVGEKLK